MRYAGPQRRPPLLPVFGVRAGDHYVNDWVTRFDPLHAVFTFHWTSPAGLARPLAVRTAVFMVPETDATTRFHVFIFASVAPGSFLRRLLPVVRRAALFIGRREVAADAAIVRHVRTPDSLEGLRLTKFDKPLVHNRKLLDALYFGLPRTRLPAEREPSSSRDELVPGAPDHPPH